MVANGPDYYLDMYLSLNGATKIMITRIDGNGPSNLLFNVLKYITILLRNKLRAIMSPKSVIDSINCGTTNAKHE